MRMEFIPAFREDRFINPPGLWITDRLPFIPNKP